MTRSTLSPLIESAELADEISSGNVVVLDCRFSLADTTKGRQKYDISHIPGAHYAHLDNDLSAEIVPGQSGRHPLPERNRFLTTLKQWGVNQDSLVVAYDDAAGAIAARAWWLCLWMGIPNVKVLNGGFKAWMTENRPVSTETSPPGNGSVRSAQPLVSLVRSEEVLDEQHFLVDARDEIRFTGEQEPLDPIGGHIPGAVNLPFTGNLSAEPKFIDKDKIKDRFNELIDKAGSKTIVHYCGSGVTAAHNILAMHQIGMTNSALYAGSWSEWVQDRNRPISTGF